MATVECTWSGRLDGGSGRHIVGSPAVSDRPTAVSPCCCYSDCWRTWRWSARMSPSEQYRLTLESPSRPRPAGRTLWNRPLSTILSVNRFKLFIRLSFFHVFIERITDTEVMRTLADSSLTVEWLCVHAILDVTRNLSMIQDLPTKLSLRVS